MRAATVAGVRHRLDGRRGEDAYGWADGPGGLVVAVADGVSATPQAALAAQVAVTAATGVDVGEVEGDGESALSVVCAAALSDAAAAVAAAVGDAAMGATTLVVAVLAADGRWAASRVGDSDAFVLEAAGWLPVFGGAGDDDVRSGVTDALPLTRGAPQAMGGRLAGDQALVLLSDGVAGPLRDGPSTVALGLAQGLVVPPSPLQLARLVDFARQGCHDDRTLLAVWLRCA